MQIRSSAEVVRRRVVPGLVVALSRVDWPARLGAASRRRLGRRARVELYFAFDDPCSAVAVIGLAERLAGSDVRLLLRPVVQRGIPGDPAVDQKRAYAVDDARRLFRRSGRTLRRAAPIPAQDVAFLAAWATAIPAGPALTRFCTRAMERLWLETDGPVAAAEYAELWREAVGTLPPADEPERTDAVRSDERRMARRGPYDTPAAWVHGQWFFAHERMPQIEGRLAGLGWIRA